jgi:hypothetical protein
MMPEDRAEAMVKCGRGGQRPCEVMPEREAEDLCG